MDTVKLASTVQELQYQQVLYNLSLFLKHSDTLPSMVLITTGQAQVAEQAAVGVTASNPPGVSPAWIFPFAAAHTATQKWDVKPITAPSDLKRLRYLFSWAAAGHQESAAAQVEAPAGTAMAKHTDPSAGLSKYFLPKGEETADPEGLYSELPNHLRTWYKIGEPPNDVRFKCRHGDTTLYVENEGDFADFTLVVLGAMPQTMKDANLMIPSNILLSP